MITYRCTHMTKEVEEDSFERGLEGPRSISDSRGMHIEAETIAQLIHKIKKETALEFSEVFLPVATEPGDSVGIFCTTVMEDADGNVPTPRQMNLWRRGKLKLYACEYIFHIEKVQTLPIRRTEFTEAGISIDE